MCQCVCVSKCAFHIDEWCLNLYIEGLIAEQFCYKLGIILANVATVCNPEHANKVCNT